MVVLANGENAFRLVNGDGTDVGWIRSRTIGFGGFDSEAAAIAAALDGGRALASCLKREFGAPHPAITDDPRPRKVHDGAYEWIADGRVPIARLLRGDPRDGDASLAIEFVLPSYATDAIAINAALIVHDALGPRARSLVGSPSVAALPSD